MGAAQAPCDGPHTAMASTVTGCHDRMRNKRATYPGTEAMLALTALVLSALGVLAAAPTRAALNAVGRDVRAARSTETDRSLRVTELALVAPGSQGI